MTYLVDTISEISTSRSSDCAFGPHYAMMRGTANAHTKSSPLTFVELSVAWLSLSTNNREITYHKSI